MGLAELIILAYFSIYILLPILGSYFLIFCGVIVVFLLLLLTVLKKIFSIPRLIYNGELEPVWRAGPRIWNESNSWKDFFVATYEHDKSQLKKIFC